MATITAISQYSRSDALIAAATSSSSSAELWWLTSLCVVVPFDASDRFELYAIVK